MSESQKSTEGHKLFPTYIYPIILIVVSGFCGCLFQQWKDRADMPIPLFKCEIERNMKFGNGIYDYFKFEIVNDGEKKELLMNRIIAKFDKKIEKNICNISDPEKFGIDITINENDVFGKCHGEKVTGIPAGDGKYDFGIFVQTGASVTAYLDPVGGKRTMVKIQKDAQWLPDKSVLAEAGKQK